MPNPVTLNDAAKAVVDYRLNNLHTAMPGAIVTYDFEQQKASVQPLLNKVWADGTTTPYPILENVPVMLPRVAGGGLTFPVVEGDTCLLLFIERSTDLWLTVGGQVSPDDPRKFDLSDGVAIMGLFPFTETSTADNNTDMVLTFEGSTIRIKANGDIVIQTSSKVAIGTQTNELLKIVSDLLQSLSISVTTTVGQPIQGALPATTYSALKAQIEAIRGTIP